MEWREKLEEENEEIETENKNTKGKGKGEEGRKVLSEEEIEERCEDLRARLLKEMMSEEEGGGAGGGGGRGKKLKSFQVHELAEAKIEESERLRKALGIEEDRETGEISSHRPRRGYSDRERREERENERD